MPFISANGCYAGGQPTQSYVRAALFFLARSAIRNLKYAISSFPAIYNLKYAFRLHPLAAES